MGFGQYDGLGEYCGIHTASSAFLILILTLDLEVSAGGARPGAVGDAHAVLVGVLPEDVVNLEDVTVALLVHLVLVVVHQLAGTLEPRCGKRVISQEFMWINEKLEPETLYHRDDALLYITYVMLIWAAPISADRWHYSLWP